MEVVGKFEKVSTEQFVKDFEDSKGKFYDTQEIYENIRLPKRATKGSAGYDFFLPMPIELLPGETITIPTGIRVRIKEGWVLQIYPRSSLGFKFSLHLNNTVGIIDSDYYSSDNEGHILVKLTNGSVEGQKMNLMANTAFVQGLFLSYGITVDDQTTQNRNGGFGSTN